MNKANDNLTTLREQIDQLDKNIIAILAQRFQITKKIGQIKAGQRFSSVDEARLNEVINRWREMGAQAGLDAGLMEAIVTSIHDAVVVEHEECKLRTTVD